MRNRRPFSNVSVDMASLTPAIRHSRIPTFLAVLVLMVAGMALPAGAETKVEATTPAGGRYQPGTPTPLLITITSDRAIAGTLIATVDGIPSGELTIEVPGGSAKDFVMIVQTPPWGSQISVRFESSDGKDDKTIRVNLQTAGSDELVGVLPDLAARNLPETADLSIDLGIARFFSLDPSILNSGSDILSPFDHVLATAQDLQNLDAQQLAAIEQWVGSSGGVLLIDEAPGTTIPLAVDTPGEAVTTYGLGTVVFTGGDAAAGSYDGLVRPTVSSNSDEMPWGNEGFGSIPTTMILAQDAGLEVPSIKVILILLAGYTILVGPVLWFLLKKSRRETSLWIAVPLVALLATAGVYVLGQRQRLGVATAHATVVADLPTTRLVRTEILVSSPNGGSEGLKLREGWKASTVRVDESFFWERGPGQVPTAPQIHGSDLTLDLPPGGTGTVAAQTSQDRTDPVWEIDLVADGDQLIGTVTNRSGYELQESFLVVGQGLVRLGTIDDGQSKDVTVKPGSAFSPEGDPLMEQLYRHDPWSPDHEGVVNAGAIGNLLGAHPNLRGPGIAFVAGWTRDAPGPLDSTRGGEIDAGRTAFVSVERVQSSTTEVGTTTMELLRGMNTRILDSPAPGQCNDFNVAIRLKPAVAPTTSDELILEASSRSIAAFDVWDGSQWLPGRMADSVGEPQRLLGLPVEAFADGAAYVRVTLSCDFWGSNEFVTLRPAGHGEAITTWADAMMSEGVANG